ncbi:MAG: transaldolase [Longimicrobiales bacterium]
MTERILERAAPAEEVTAPLRVAIYLDGASLPDMEEAMGRGVVEGFTTNPTLARKAGVRNYREFAREALARVSGLPISFEVLGDDLASIGAQAREIASWGGNVFVKVPICTTRRVSTIPVIAELSAEGVRVNVTAVMARRQVEEVLSVLPPGVPGIVSIFAGRIADTGRDPCPFMHEAVELRGSRSELKVLWASPREVLNVYQADACGVDVIVLTADLLAKLALRGKDLEEFSRETVAMFYEDGVRAGYAL